MFANTSTGERQMNPISQWEDDGGPVSALPTPERARVNVGAVERALSAYVGGSLVTWGLSRRSLPGLLVAAAGGALIYRGATGHCRLYDALGMSTADQDVKLTGAASSCGSTDRPRECSAPQATSQAGAANSFSESPQQQTQWDMPIVGTPPVSAPISAVVEKDAVEKETVPHSMS